MLKGELTETKAKEKVVGVFKTDLDNKRNKINPLKKKVDKKKPR
jgi:hypothetical protein